MVGGPPAVPAGGLPGTAGCDAVTVFVRTNPPLATACAGAAFDGGTALGTELGADCAAFATGRPKPPLLADSADAAGCDAVGVVAGEGAGARPKPPLLVVCAGSAALPQLLGAAAGGEARVENDDGDEDEGENVDAPNEFGVVPTSNSSAQSADKIRRGVFKRSS